MYLLAIAISCSSKNHPTLISMRAKQPCIYIHLYDRTKDNRRAAVVSLARRAPLRVLKSCLRVYTRGVKRGKRRGRTSSVSGKEEERNVRRNIEEQRVGGEMEERVLNGEPRRRFVGRMSRGG